MSEAAAVPGWYPDPWYPGMSRWFDGSTWTEHVAPMGLPYGPDDFYDAERGRSTAGWARWAFLARGAAAGLQTALGGILFSRIWDSFTDNLAEPQSAQSFNGVDLGAYMAVSQLASLAVYGGLVFVCIWTFRATKNARLLGLPTTFSPGWAVGGWLIPFANFVMPYLSVRDLFPEGHPGRRAAAVWWATEMTGVVTGMVALGLSLAVASIGIALGIAAGVLMFAAGVLGSRLCQTAAAFHQELASSRTAT